MKSKSYLAVCIAAVWLISVSLAGADVIFQADFKGDKGGVGGASDLVTIGGVGTLNGHTNTSNTMSYTGSVQKTPPLGEGPCLHYSLNRQEDSSGTPGAGSAVEFTPTAPASSWSALATASNGHVLLNGGADFFVRINQATGMTAEWFRPLDVGDSKTQLRLDVSTVDDNNSQQQIQLEVIGPGGALTGTSRVTIPSPLTVGGLYHFAFSFSSASNGSITMTLYVATGLGAINTDEPGHSVFTATGVFQIDASKIQRPDILPVDAFTFGGGWFGTTASSLDADYACFRIYSSAPKTFEALPVTPASSIPTL